MFLQVPSTAPRSQQLETCASRTQAGSARSLPSPPHRTEAIDAAKRTGMCCICSSLANLLLDNDSMPRWQAAKTDEEATEGFCDVEESCDVELVEDSI